MTINYKLPKKMTVKQRATYTSLIKSLVIAYHAGGAYMSMGEREQQLRDLSPVANYRFAYPYSDIVYYDTCFQEKARQDFLKSQLK